MAEAQPNPLPVAIQAIEPKPVPTPLGGAVTANGAVAAPPLPAPAALPPQTIAAAPAERIPTRKLIADSDEEIPSDADLLEMSPRALKGRLDRNTKAQLRERFGVDNFDAVKTQLDELAAYKAKEEAGRLAEMTEADRYKELYTKELSAREALEVQVAQQAESRMIEDQDRRVIAIAADFVKPKHFNYVTQELAAHLQTLTEEDLRDPEKYIGGWFEEWTTKNPEFGKDFGNTQSSPVAAPQAPSAPRQVPLTNTPNAMRPNTTQPAGSAHQKTAAPGKPNSMDENEWRQYKRANNLHW